MICTVQAGNPGQVVSPGIVPAEISISQPGDIQHIIVGRSLTQARVKRRISRCRKYQQENPGIDPTPQTYLLHGVFLLQTRSWQGWSG